MWIERNGEILSIVMSQDDFLKSSLPSKGWVETSEPPPVPLYISTYQELRAGEYPPMQDYLDAIVKGDQVQMQQYIDACLAVKAKYPK